MTLRASVCIPTYNRREALVRVLRALDEQTVAPDRFETIVAIDGSSDGTESALRQLRLRFSLRWIVQNNRGPAAARNAAAQWATGDVVLSLDDDQIAAPGLVGAHLAAHERYGDVVVQGSVPLAAGFDRRGASLAYERSRARAMRASGDRQLLSRNLWAGNFSVRRQTWSRVGGFDEGFTGWGGEDTDFGLRLEALAIPFVFSSDAVSYHEHRVGYASWRRQAYSAGRAVVRISRKHGLPLRELSPSETDSRLSRLLGHVWNVSPAGMHAAGQLFVAGLWLADGIRIPALQLGSAQLVRRFYKVGGMARETRGEKRPAGLIGQRQAERP